MIAPKALVDSLSAAGVDFFVGVPDSLLRSFLSFITDHVPPRRHITAANEGGAVSFAAGYYLATNRMPLVYLQNSGLGNAINPLVSLTHPDVYGVPMLLLIGWRGQPGVKDEPQHIVQGAITPALLELMRIPVLQLDGQGSIAECIDAAVGKSLEVRGPVALLCGAATFESYVSSKEETRDEFSREEAIEVVLDSSDQQALVVATTGHISRELFELRVKRNEPHDRDFLTVGSMGHASQLALGLAIGAPQRQVYCLDGDGAFLMHMGSAALIGQLRPPNLCHVVLNNKVHDSVGGQPTAASDLRTADVAKACGYETVVHVRDRKGLQASLTGSLKRPALIEAVVRPGSRPNLGRPTIHPKEACSIFRHAVRG